MSSDAETTPKAPRRGTRDRKTVKPFLSPDAKRKRVEAEGNSSDVEGTTSGRSTGKEDGESSEEEQPEQEEPQEESGQSEEEEGEEYKAPRASAGAGRGRGRGRGKATSGTSRLTSKKSGAAKPRATKARAQGEGGTGEVAIAKDNALFNALLNPSAALQSVVDDYFESYSESPSAALADLANCILRACGCNASLDSDEVLDSDNVVDKLDDLIEAAKKESSPTYPLASKHPTYKKFRKSLSELLHRLIQTAADLPQPSPLYPSSDDTGLLPVLQPWIVVCRRRLSEAFGIRGQSLRSKWSLRCARSLETLKRKERSSDDNARLSVSVVRAPAKGKGKTPREKELDSKAEDVKARKGVLNDYLKEFFDDVFVHRYRDADPGIRADCVRELGKWMKSTSVRLEAIKALSAQYTSSDNSTVLALTNFTERFKPRLLQMAAQDSDVGVRVAVARVLTDIDTQGLLEEDEQAPLCLLLFDVEARVRRAVAGFVRGVWDAAVEEKLVGKGSKGKDKEKDKERAGVKCFLSLLVSWIKLADTSNANGSTHLWNGLSLLLNSPGTKSRIALAVSALWDELPALREWEVLLDHILLDHSGGGEPGVMTSPSKRRAAKNTDQEGDPAWRLSEAEESVAMEVLIAVLECVKEEATLGKKGEDESVTMDITRALMKALPRLFAKVQTDEKRVGDVLVLPQLMNLDMYVELRETPAYEQLWSDVTKQFMTHSSPTVLRHAVATIQHLSQTTSLANTNATKIIELEDELATSVRELIAGREELDIVTFTEDEVHALSAFVLRLHTLYGVRDMTSWMEEDEGGKVARLVDILGTLTERGRLGYKEEEMMMNESLHLLVLYIAWKVRLLQMNPVPEDERENAYEELKTIRDSLATRLTEFAVGTQSNTAEGVKQSAFQCLLNLYILFQPSRSAEETQALKQPIPMVFSDELQVRCAGFIQAEIEKYVDLLEEEHGNKDRHSEDEESSSSELSDEDGTKAKKIKKAKKAPKKVERAESQDTQLLPQGRLEREYAFHLVVSAFLRAIRTGAINIEHSAVLLGHYGRVSSVYDQCTKVIIEVLREEGMYGGNAELVGRVLVNALQESFSLYIDNITKSDVNTIALAKALQSAIVIRGAQLSIVRRLDTAQVASGSKQWGTRALEIGLSPFSEVLWLLGTVESADAIRIKNHLDVSLQDAKIETPASSKVWEPLRAYDKRLITAMAKDKALAARIKTGNKKKSTAVVTTDDEREADEGRATDDEHEAGAGEDQDDAPPPLPAPKTRARPGPKPKKPTTDDEDENRDTDIPDAPAEEPGSRSPTPTPPAPKTRKSTRATAAKEKATLNTRKRRRGAGEEEQEAEEVEEEPEVEAEPEAPAPAPGSKPPSQATSDVGFTRRRKRAKA
ncbi:cohesin protein [Ceratobasidium sp. AG-Ba]|nr:cohesin protein [Ceratobasidium sp. AG-Ba]